MRKYMNRVFKRIVIVTLVFIILYLVMDAVEHRDAELMSMNYCWDSHGQHYLVPNKACR